MQNVGARHDTTITHKPSRVNALIINDSLCYMLLHCLHIITLLTALSPDITAHGEKRASQLRFPSAKSCSGETTTGSTVRESFAQASTTYCYVTSGVFSFQTEKKPGNSPTFQFSNYFKVYHRSTQMYVIQIINK